MANAAGKGGLGEPDILIWHMLGERKAAKDVVVIKAW
jgi:hypothetical protein